SLWKGRIDEFRILARAISRAEAALDYRRGFAALATGDNWRTSRLATQYDHGGLPEGQPGPAVLTASGFALARSTYAVSIEVVVADVDGHFTSAAFPVSVAPADATPLSFSGAEISTDAARWHPQGAIPVPGRADFRVNVHDPALGDALRSGIGTSTQAAPFTLIPNTLLLLHLDEGTGVPLDSSGNAFAMTLQNGPAWVSGRFGGALQFNSDYQYLLPSGSPSGLDVPNWTASVWVYPTETPNGGIISKINDGRYGFRLRGAAGRPQLSVHNSVNGGATVTAPDVLPLNQWTQLTATSDLGVVRLYVNGELKASAANFMQPNSAPFIIGAGDNGGPPFWKGRLDEIRYMNRPQAAEEVLLDYRRGYAALFSSNGGTSWTSPALSYGAAAQGDLNAVLSVSSLTLTDSLTGNVLQLFAADGAGNTSSATFVLPAAFDATAPASPVIVSTQLVSNGAVAIAWQHAPGEVPVSYSLYRATEPISSLAGLLPVATTSAVNLLDTPSPTLGDVHYYALTAKDIQGNVSAPSSSVQTLFDHTPPVSALVVQGSSAAAAGNIYVLPSSTLTLGAIDQGTAISGIAMASLALNGVPVVASTASFQLGEGAYHLSYFATDAAGNAETPRVSTVVVDATAPVSTFTVPGGGTRDSLDRMIIVAGQEVVLTAQDAMVGVTQILYRVDSGTWSAVAAPLAIPEGQHVLQFYAVDALGNTEAPRSQSFVVALAQMSGVFVASPTATSFAISWSSMANAAGYVVLVSSSPDFSTVDFSTAVETRQVLVEGLRPSTTYLVRVAFFSESNDGLPVTITAMTASDLQAPSLTVFPADRSTVTTPSPPLIALYADAESGISTATLRLVLDGTDMTSRTLVGVSSAAAIVSTPLAQGAHTFEATVADFFGNTASTLATFLVDSLPPITGLRVNGLAVGSTNLVLVSTDAVSFAAADSGVGVLETRYSVDGSSETLFAAPFFLSTGNSSLSFHSRDLAGNQEAGRVVSIVVTIPPSDTTPPLVRLDLPGVSALGVEQALGGVVDVRGAVSDASALTWTLEAAPGASATGGFATIASGAGNVSGLIAAWNTTSLSGYQTVRLRATDAFGNSASATATVFVGGPVFTFAVGRKDSNVFVNTIKGPTGIAVRSDGAIWVASTENDKILLFSPAGVLLGEAGHAPGHSGREKEHGKKDKDHDDEDENEDKGSLSFKTPQGLALDSADNLYVADRDLNRVVKLSPDGRGLLLQLGRAGSGNGELRHPFDVAVDGNGDIYVADSGNRRIQVFNSSGGYLRQFGAGVLLSTSEVRGIALTVEGLWVSDKEQERMFLFSRAGVLLKSIGGADSAVGELSRMRGLASDRLGALYVVEPNRDRVQKFDPLGKGLLAFGSKAGLSQADKKAKRYLTQPIDAAMAPDGSIWIADTGRDRIVRYALPSSGGYGTAAYAAGGGEFSSSSAEPARRIVDHKDGAKIERDDGAGVSVPRGALAADLEITVDKGDENQDKEQKTAKRRDMNITAVSEEVQYGPEGTTFAAPVTLILPYDANLLASQGIREDDLKVYYWNPTLKDWQAMPSTVNKQNKTVHAQTTHFSAYQVGGLGGIGVAAVDDFGLRDGYAFPNPTRNGSAVTFRMQPGSVDSIEVRVYDLSGRKVHSSSDFRFLGAIDDGNGKGVQNTYDHVWNVSGVGSGVYTFVMTARKAGQPDLRKTGKVGIIR
ncbi:MAG: hypothetical protein HYX59_00595, partial [Elusimicrobia bacterium]|nr:hypothetical protein [Elusimicrobiota bacterium]